MKTNTITLLTEYLSIAEGLSSREELKQLNVRYQQLISADGQEPDEQTRQFAERLFAVMSELISQREKLNILTKNKDALSEREKEENAKVQRILDLNLLTYHFQPIVRADNGEIFSYEALMRPKGIEGITPFHILKYAELTDRLSEVEKYTFLNVLTIVDTHRELFESSPVFINSMPKVRLDAESYERIEEMFRQLSDCVVVEMTENSEYNDSDLNDIKQKFRRLKIPIAIDDYGTGYSNISNLLRYTPNYVKIDRSLLSGIQDSPNKRHFVREIVDFCHDNGIMALAEGVESSQELRTVILLGVDLIQGYYTARPSAELIDKLPYAVRAEIKNHHQELEDGRRSRIYSVQKGEKAILYKLAKEGYNCLRIGSGYSDGSVTVAGSQFADPDIHIEIAEGFGGEVILDSASLSNLPGRPCIDIGSGCDVTIELRGLSRLINSGIRVPASAQLTFTGLGSIDIRLGSIDYYGIGNDLASAHGYIHFDQDGTVSVSASSHSGVLIGSGLGGRINIGRGRYVLNAKGALNVCLGAVDGDIDIELHGCDFEGSASGAYSIVVGSMYGSANIHAIYSSVKCRSESQLGAAMGCVGCGNISVSAESVNMDFEISADMLTAFGALRGSSDIKIDRASVSIDAEGANALLFGGFEGGTRIGLTDIDISAKLSTELDSFIIAEKEDIHTVGGKYRLKVNGKELDRF